MNPDGNIADIFNRLKTNPKLLDDLKVQVLPYTDKPMYYEKPYKSFYPMARNGLDKGDVARLEIVTDDDGTHYVIYPPKQEPAFDVDKASRVEEIFADNKWKAYWDSEDDYPEMNLQWVEEYFEDLAHTTCLLSDYRTQIAAWLNM